MRTYCYPNARARRLSYFSRSHPVCAMRLVLKSLPVQSITAGADFVKFSYKAHICPPLPIRISSSNNPAGPDFNQNLTWPDVFPMSPSWIIEHSSIIYEPMCTSGPLLFYLLSMYTSSRQSAQFCSSLFPIFLCLLVFLRVFLSHCSNSSHSNFLPLCLVQPVTSLL